MLLLANTTDKIQVITGQAVTVDVVTSFMDASNADPPVVKGSTSGRLNTAITTAATTDIVAAPAASTLRNVKTVHIRNKHASSSVDITVQYNQNGTLFEIHKVTLKAGEALEYIEGIGWYTLSPSTFNGSRDGSLTSQTGFAADTYLAGSYLLFPSGGPTVGMLYEMTFDVVKTAAGTATPIITVRVGTGGSTADTARLTFTFGAGTAAIDKGEFKVHALFRTVGSGTAAVLQGRSRLVSDLTTTGLSNAVKALQVTSAGFDSTTANSGIGVSYNGGASAAHTVQLVECSLIQT